MVTLEQAKMHLKIDHEDEDDYIDKIIEASDIYINSMVGETYKTNENAVKLAELLQLKLITDLYDNRSRNIKMNVKEDKIVISILDKLSNYL